MSKQTMEWLKKALKWLDLSEIKRIERLIIWVSGKIPNTCRCEIARYCECETCEAHRNRIPLNRSWAERGRSLNDWLEACDCKDCVEHRKKQELKCYDCTKQENLSVWLDQFEDALRDVRVQIIASYNRIGKKLKSWENRTRINNSYSQNQFQQQTQFRPSRHLNPNYEGDEEVGFDPSSLYE